MSRPHRDSGLPGDIVLRPVESVTVERVETITPLCADPEPTEPIFDFRTTFPPNFAQVLSAPS
jgi:hypothetical protein